MSQKRVIDMQCFFRSRHNLNMACHQTDRKPLLPRSYSTVSKFTLAIDIPCFYYESETESLIFRFKVNGENFEKRYRMAAESAQG